MTEERILDAYRTTWNDFYAWEIGYASEVIASLLIDSPARDAPSTEDSDFSQDMDIRRFRFEKGPISGASMSSPMVLPSVQAHPRYQAYTPSNQNVMVKRHQDNPFSTALFIPFADEPRFQSKYFLEEFLQDSEYTDPKLHWQSLPDPDCAYPYFNAPGKGVLIVDSRGYSASSTLETSQTRLHRVSDRCGSGVTRNRRRWSALGV